MIEWVCRVERTGRMMPVRVRAWVCECVVECAYVCGSVCACVR